MPVVVWWTKRRWPKRCNLAMSPVPPFDVFSEEPAKENALFNLPNVVCTPHLGAATTEAQENVALQVAEQMSNYLLTGAVENALTCRA